MSDASLRELEKRWSRGERSDELATALIVERLRCGLVSERRVCMAVASGYPPAVATGLPPDGVVAGKIAKHGAIHGCNNGFPGGLYELTPPEQAGLAIAFTQRALPRWAKLRPGDPLFDRAIQVGLRRTAGLATDAEAEQAGEQVKDVESSLPWPLGRSFTCLAHAVAWGDCAAASMNATAVLSRDDQMQLSAALRDRERAAQDRLVAEFLCGLSSLPGWVGAPPERVQPAWAVDRPGWEAQGPEYLSARLEQGLAAEDLLVLAAGLGHTCAVAWLAAERTRRSEQERWRTSVHEDRRLEVTPPDSLASFDARRLLLLDDDPELRAVLARWTIEIVEQGARWLSRTNPTDGLAVQRLVDAYRAHLQGEATVACLLEARSEALACVRGRFASARSRVVLAAAWMTWGPRAWGACRRAIQQAAARWAAERLGGPLPPESLEPCVVTDVPCDNAVGEYDQAAYQRFLEVEAAARSAEEMSGRQALHLARLLAERPPAFGPGACLRPREVMLTARLRSRCVEVLLEERPGRSTSFDLGSMPFDFLPRVRGLREAIEARLPLVSGSWLLRPAEGGSPRAIDRGSSFDLGDGEVVVTWATESLDQLHT